MYWHQEIYSYTSCFLKKYPCVVEIADTSVCIELKSHLSSINYILEGYVYNLLGRKIFTNTSTWWDYNESLFLFVYTYLYFNSSLYFFSQWTCIAFINKTIKKNTKRTSRISRGALSYQNQLDDGLPLHLDLLVIGSSIYFSFCIAL